MCLERENILMWGLKGVRIGEDIKGKGGELGKKD